MKQVNNNAVIVDANTQRISALKEHVPAKTEISMNGVTYTAAALIAIYQGSLDSRAALIKSRGQVKADLATRRGAEATRAEVEPGLRSWVIAKFGADSTEAHEFGYAAPKKGKKSAEDKANAVKLAQATRDARGTMGKKEKLKIKGTLPAPDAPANPATNAPPAPPAGAAKANGAPAPAPNASGGAPAN